jgi:hypothetical protein
MQSERLDPMSLIGEIAALAAAGGVGSLLTQAVSRSGERRTLRAKVREELWNVEVLRWAVEADQETTQKQSADLRSARRRLHSAAMLAHLPRELIEKYDQLALAALASSKDSLARGEPNGVPGVVNDCVLAAYGLICDLLWRPTITRLTYPWRFKKLRKIVSENKETDAGSSLLFAYDPL